jgi:hypothetical protein
LNKKNKKQNLIKGKGMDNKNLAIVERDDFGQAIPHPIIKKMVISF